MGGRKEVKNLNDEQIVEGANVGPDVVTTVMDGIDKRLPIEMMRRLKDSIIDLNRATSRYSIILIVLSVIMATEVPVQICLAVFKK